jgi:uncharacterized protein
VTIICNATPLINFAAINRLDILQTTLGPIIIPQAVYDETTVISFPGSESVIQAVTSGWLQVRQASAVGSDIPVELDNGEREAIALALEMKTQQILLDEQEGILLLAKRKQIIPEVHPLLDAMINTAQYWVKDTLYQDVLRQAGEA